jgi:hypothetical protein
MTLTYKKLTKHPHSLRRLLGIDRDKMEQLVVSLTPLWEAHLSANYRRPGRSYKHTLGSMVSLLLIYYRSYITQEFLGYLFDLDKANICRIIQKLEPLLAQILPIPKRRVLTKEEVSTLILDVTEQPIERPKKGQKVYYSGKKKLHTLKTEVRIDQNGTIVQLSKPYPGSVHDFALFKQEPPPPDDIELLADAGYQGLHKLHEMASTPYKGSKTQPLCSAKKAYNRALSSQRCLVEHKIGSIKVFKIIGNRYRNKRKRYALKFSIVTGLVNLNHAVALRERVA